MTKKKIQSEQNLENKSNVGDIENAIQTNKIQSRDAKKKSNVNK